MLFLLSLGSGAVLFIAFAVLLVYAPDLLSQVILGIMFLVLLAGYINGIFKLLGFASGFSHARLMIHEAYKENPRDVLLYLRELEYFFRNRKMDDGFQEYCDRIDQQKKEGTVLTDIDAVFNSDTIGLETRDSVVAQIPGTFTGLGLLGTFIGLITGISDISFTTIEVAIQSIQSLLQGIETAFYTSIAGVILSLLFNLFHNYAWNIMENEMELFIRDFHDGVMPSTEMQSYRAERTGVQKILEYLNQFSQGGGIASAENTETKKENEKILMPQILSGLENGEFTFYLLPCYDLNTRKMLNAEALVRWRHSDMGLVSPGIFLPILEKNGAIVQLDKYIWNKVFRTLRKWMDEHRRVIPISINISKTDLMSMDVAQYLEELMKEYNISPRYVEIDVDMDAYIQAPDYMIAVQEKLQRRGFRIVIDGFDGNYLSLNEHFPVSADALKLDLRKIQKEKGQGFDVASAISFSKNKRIAIIANGIQNMEQLSLLRKNGCFEGQGYLLSRELSIEEFEEKLDGKDKS